MIEVAEKLDNALIWTVDGFCRHIQDHLGVPFGWMLSFISIGTAVIAFTAAMLMFAGDQLAGRAVFALLWAGCLILVTLFFRRTLWHQMRRGPSHLVAQYWTRMAMMARTEGRPMRYFTLFGTAILALISTLQLVMGSTGLALASLRFLFVSLFPIILMMYAFCAIPSPPDAE